MQCNLCISSQTLRRYQTGLPGPARDEPRRLGRGAVSEARLSGRLTVGHRVREAAECREQPVHPRVRQYLAEPSGLTIAMPRSEVTLTLGC
jgi:hypothetical protein